MSKEFTSVKEVIRAVEYYGEEKNRIHRLYKETKKINDSIDLNEVRLKLDYSQTSKLYKSLIGFNDNEEMFKELAEIKRLKKIEAYPEMLDIHYYPELKELNLSNEVGIKIDNQLKEAFRNENVRVLLHKLDKTILEFLQNKKIISREYIFYCNCGSGECFREVLSAKRVEAMKDYWKKSSEGLADDKYGISDGYFEVGCWNSGGYEVYSLETFNENVENFEEYRVIKAPDMTLDNL